MRRRAFTTVIILFTVLAYHPGLAQEWPFELWHEGKIVLEERDTLVGLVKYDQQQDLVQFSDHQLANEIYSARKVLFFEIFDASANRYRKFFTLPYSGAGQYKAPVFFELLTEGKLTLLSREYLELRTISSPYSIHGYTREVLAYRFFFLNEDGEIVEFVGKKNDLLELMGDKSKDVNKFIRVNRLRVEEKYDMLRIIDYYNSLFRV